MSSAAETFLAPPAKLPRRSSIISIHGSSSTISIHGNSTSSPASLHDFCLNPSFSPVNFCSASLIDQSKNSASLTDQSKNSSRDTTLQQLQISIASTSSSAISPSDASSTCSLHPPLQPHLWSQLPEELIERILAFLPVSSIFRFRSVCKDWQSLPFSPGFLQLRTLHVPAQAAHFLLLSRSRSHHLSAYEPLSNKWHGFSVGFLPVMAYPVAAAKGLICFVSSGFETGHTTLLVCNPLTRSWKELPALMYNRVPFLVSMAVDRKARTYKILVAGGADDSYSNRRLARRSTEMYDSATGNWTLCGSLPQNEGISRNVVEHSGYYLCLGKGSGSGLLAFNVQTQMWIKMRTGRIPGYSKFRHLVECGGSILIVGKALRRYVLGLYIWCLDPTTLRWKEVGKMPRAISDQFFTSPSECFYCTSQGHLIFFSRYFHDQGLVYNFADNSWQQVTGCPLLTNSLLLPFDPGLDPVE